MTERRKYEVSSPTLRAKEYKLSRFMYILQRNFKFMLRLDSKAHIESDSVVCQYLARRRCLLLRSLLRESYLKTAAPRHLSQAAGSGERQAGGEENGKVWTLVFILTRLRGS